MTNEQIQALEAAAEKASGGDWIKESGDGWEALCSTDDQVNEGFIIAHFEGPDSEVNRKFIQHANPAAILSLLAEREANKKRITELEGALSLASASFANERMRADALEARTLTVKLPGIIGPEAAPAHYWDNSESMAYADGYNKAISAAKESCAAAGIKLDVGE